MPEPPQPERSQTEQGLTVRRSGGAVAAQRAFGVVGDRGGMPLQLAHMTGRGCVRMLTKPIATPWWSVV